MRDRVRPSCRSFCFNSPRVGVDPYPGHYNQQRLGLTCCWKSWQDGGSYPQWHLARTSHPDVFLLPGCLWFRLWAKEGCEVLRSVGAMLEELHAEPYREVELGIWPECPNMDAMRPGKWCSCLAPHVAVCREFEHSGSTTKDFVGV